MTNEVLNQALSDLFQDYWKESFPNAPANKQSAASHVAFASYVLAQVEANFEDEDEGEDE
jgi:hypothetical protein